MEGTGQAAGSGKGGLMRRLLEEILAGALLTAIAIGLGLGW